MVDIHGNGCDSLDFGMVVDVFGTDCDSLDVGVVVGVNVEYCDTCLTKLKKARHMSHQA